MQFSAYLTKEYHDRLVKVCQGTCYSVHGAMLTSTKSYTNRIVHCLKQHPWYYRL